MGALISALQRIQDQFGYLKRDALEQYTAESGVPLYRLHSVASFFPHFRLAPPPPVTIRVCRDMACHLAGSRKIITDLTAAAQSREGQVAVQGVSCLGRCDRAPAACVALAGSGHERYYVGRTTEDLKQIARACLDG